MTGSDVRLYLRSVDHLPLSKIAMQINSWDNVPAHMDVHAFMCTEAEVEIRLHGFPCFVFQKEFDIVDENEVGAPRKSSKSFNNKTYNKGHWELLLNSTGPRLHALKTSIA